MRFFASLFISATIFGCSSSASPLEVRQDALQPFQVTSVSSYSPSGRPGSEPWSRIRANVTDPNSYFFSFSPTRNLTVPGGSQGFNCEAQWHRGESPQGRSWYCGVAGPGHWAMQVLPSTSGSEYTSVSDFRLKFIHTVEPSAPFKKISSEAEVSLASGGNMIGRCLSSGSCTFVLGADYKPLLAPATKVL